MELNELCALAHQRAIDAGWWEPGKEKTALECHMLIVSEVAEATEAVRNRQPSFFVNIVGLGGQAGTVVAPQVTAEQVADVMAMAPGAKPEGEATELADAVIRIADWFGRKGWDLEKVIRAKMEYNLTRTHRHGGKAY